MKKLSILLLAGFLLSGWVRAQQGQNAIGFGGDLSLPTSDFGTFFKNGIGFYTKALFGVGTAGQVTFTGGYSSFKEAGDFDDFSTTISIAPLLVGYRHNINGFFVEPQLGYGVYGVKLSDGFNNQSESSGLFTWAASAGYVFNKQFEVSGRYQTGGKNGTNFSLFGLRLGYNISLGNHPSARRRRS